MNHQGKIWDREYREKTFVTLKEGPQSDTLKFLKYLKKERGFIVKDRTILDLGCGTGRNSNYLADESKVIGFEISDIALSLAKKRAKEMNVSVDYRLRDIGDVWDIESDSIDIILDITSSNSLSEKGRETYLNECCRVLKSGGYMFVRSLCKDGNNNVKYLLKNHPGKEKDTYIMPKNNLIERVFSREDFIKMYGQYFKILKLDKKTNYPKFDGRIYKRDYFIAYLQK